MWSKSLWISRILLWEPFNLWLVITWWGIKVSFSALKKRRYSRYYRQYFRLDWVVCHPNTNKSSWLTTSWYCHDWVPKDTTLVKITTKEFSFSHNLHSFQIQNLILLYLITLTLSLSIFSQLSQLSLWLEYSQ